MGMESEISRLERPESGNNKDCEDCTDVKIEGVGTAVVEDQHGWGIRALFLGVFLLHRLRKVPSTIVVPVPHTIFAKTFQPNGKIWM